MYLRTVEGKLIKHTGKKELRKGQWGMAGAAGQQPVGEVNSAGERASTIGGSIKTGQKGQLKGKGQWVLESLGNGQWNWKMMQRDRLS